MALKKYTPAELKIAKAAFEAGAKAEVIYKGNNSFETKKAFSSFDEYKKTLKEEEAGEE